MSKRARWRDRVGLPALLLTALISTAVTPATLSAGPAPGQTASSICAGLTRATAVRTGLTGAPVGSRAARVQAVLSKRGELTGRTLAAVSAGWAGASISLPAESFIGEATGDVVVYTKFTSAAGSEVHVLNLANECDTVLARPAEIVRSAIVDRTGRYLYVHSVTRGSRADAGVSRTHLETGIATPVVPALRPAATFGPIFGTELRWSIAADALAIQSCGFASCLTRVLDTASDRLATYDEAGQGAFVTLTREHLVTYAVCGGLPCPVLSTDLASGAVTVIAETAGEIRVEPAGLNGGARLFIETSAGILEVTQ